MSAAHALSRPRTDPRALLSTLWIFVLLNLIFRDIHELFRPGMLQQMLTGTVNGIEMTEGLLLLAGIGLEVSLAMVVLSRVLPHRLNRVANLVIPLLAIASFATNPPQDLDDIWFLVVEIIGLLLIIGLAWRWRHGHPTALH